MMNAIDCVFCKIVAGDLPADLVFQDEIVTAFRDYQPAAPTHILIVPNLHLANNNELSKTHASLAARLLTVVPEIARLEGLSQSGYRLIMNTGSDGRQDVMHLHIHLLGGQRMQHPIG